MLGVRLKRDRRAHLSLGRGIHFARNVYIHAADEASIEIAATAYLDEGTRIIARGRSRIRIGPGLWTHPGAVIYAAGDGQLTSAGELFLGRAAEINCTHRITLGKRVAFAAVCHVIDSDHSTDRDKPLGTHEEYGPIVFGNDTLCSAHVVVTRGVTVGDGAVVGANAVVTRDIPPFEIWGGVPAKKIRDRVATEGRAE